MDDFLNAENMVLISAMYQNPMDCVPVRYPHHWLRSMVDCVEPGAQTSNYKIEGVTYPLSLPVQKVAGFLCDYLKWFEPLDKRCGVGGKDWETVAIVGGEEAGVLYHLMVRLGYRNGGLIIATNTSAADGIRRYFSRTYPTGRNIPEIFLLDSFEDYANALPRADLLLSMGGFDNVKAAVRNGVMVAMRPSAVAVLHEPDGYGAVYWNGYKRNNSNKESVIMPRADDRLLFYSKPDVGLWKAVVEYNPECSRRSQRRFTKGAGMINYNKTEEA